MKKLIVLLMSLMFFVACGEESLGDAVKEVAEHSSMRTPLSTKHKQVSPIGVTVFSEKGDVTATQLAEIDKGIKQAISDGLVSFPVPRDPRWQEGSFYNVFVSTAKCWDMGGGQYGFLVKSVAGISVGGSAPQPSYDGTERDLYNPDGKGIKDGTGVILAPERIWSMGTVPNQIEKAEFLICLEGAVSNYTRYGAEHAIIWNENPQKGLETNFHDDMSPHPLLPLKK